MIRNSFHAPVSALELRHQVVQMLVARYLITSLPAPFVPGLISTLVPNFSDSSSSKRRMSRLVLTCPVFLLWIDDVLHQLLGFAH